MSATLFGSCKVNLKPSFVAVAGYWLDTGRYFYKSFWSKEDFYVCHNRLLNLYEKISMTIVYKKPLKGKSQISINYPFIR